MTLIILIIAQSIRIVYINLLLYEQQTKQSASLQIIPPQSPFPRGTPLRVVAL